MSVKRYKYGSGGMVREHDGDYVESTDYDALAAKVATLEAREATWAMRHERETKSADIANNRVRALESALLRHGHKEGSCGLCASLETETKSCGCDEVDGYLCGKNEDGLSCVCQCHTSKTGEKHGQ